MAKCLLYVRYDRFLASPSLDGYILWADAIKGNPIVHMKQRLKGWLLPFSFMPMKSIAKYERCNV